MLCLSTKKAQLQQILQLNTLIFILKATDEVSNSSKCSEDAHLEMLSRAT